MLMFGPNIYLNLKTLDAIDIYFAKQILPAQIRTKLGDDTWIGCVTDCSLVCFPDLSYILSTALLPTANR